LLSLFPVAVGFAIVFFVPQTGDAEGTATSRRLMGASFMVCGLFCWLGTAILLVYEHKFYFFFNIITVFIFVGGAAVCLFAPSGNAASVKEIGVPAIVFVVVGMTLGLCHSLALGFTESWPKILLRFYASLGRR